MEEILTLQKTNLFKRMLAPKYTVCFILGLYNVLGITLLGFNRSFTQVTLTVLSAIILQLFFDWLFFLIKNDKEHEHFTIRFPLSAMTTAFGLSILLNYGHNLVYPLIPVYLAIASKFFFTYKGKHIFNPGLMGVVLSLLITSELISPAPAYQWNGVGAMSLFIAMPALFLFFPKINRHWLVGSFLLTFILQLTLRSILIKHYLPFNTLFFGTITSPPFFLFVFFMITDPATSPSGKKEQIIVGFLLGVFDLLFHLFKSYHTFFYAALLLGSGKLIYLHFKSFRAQGLSYFKESFFLSGYYKNFVTILSIALISVGLYRYVLNDFTDVVNPQFTFTQINPVDTHMEFTKGELLDTVDPRVQHMGKWILAITDGVAVADVDNDGLLDIFFTNGHKSPEDRSILFKNLGDFKFKSIPIPEISKYAQDIKRYGVASNALFIDFDNDGDQDLYVTHAFGSEGSSRLYRNLWKEEGEIKFEHITDKLSLNLYTNSATANFFDYNRDGLLDLVIGNTIATTLPDYEKETKFDFFALPPSAYEGDERMFNFMHDSWHMANNGGRNHLFVNRGDRFEKLDSQKVGFSETRWTMAIGTADFNQDGWTDLYFANDFGPDNLYYNNQGSGFTNIEGQYFGEIGKDTYKGMNATIADFDANLMSDVYISNVHQALQAEGSLLWTFHKDKIGRPEIRDSASFAGILNENRFGWGAAAKDFNNDGYIDLAQANGMVDDRYDKLHDECPDFWYINEKIARSPPSIHRFANKWGDIRGTCIHGNEKNRLYINRGPDKRPQFSDVADTIGMDQRGNWRGMAAADFNNDGLIDLVASSLYRNPLVFKNEARHSNHWIGLELESNHPKCNRSAIGSHIYIYSEDAQGKERIQFQETTAVNGFSAQSDPRVHFGLGDHAKINKVIIKWCQQVTKEYSDLLINHYQKVSL